MPSRAAAVGVLAAELGGRRAATEPDTRAAEVFAGGACVVRRRPDERCCPARGSPSLSGAARFGGRLSSQAAGAPLPDNMSGTLSQRGGPCPVHLPPLQRSSPWRPASGQPPSIRAGTSEAMPTAATCSPWPPAPWPAPPDA